MGLTRCATLAGLTALAAASPAFASSLQLSQVPAGAPNAYVVSSTGTADENVSVLGMVLDQTGTCLPSPNDESGRAKAQAAGGYEPGTPGHVFMKAGAFSVSDTITEPNVAGANWVLCAYLISSQSPGKVQAAATLALPPFVQPAPPAKPKPPVSHKKKHKRAHKKRPRGRVRHSTPPPTATTIAT